MVATSSPVRAGFLRFMWPVYAVLLVVIAMTLNGMINGYGATYFLKEDGPFEVGAFLAIAMALIAFVVWEPRVALGSYWHVSALLALLMARELDFDKRFTDKGILQGRLYSGDYPIMQKLIGAFFVLFILLVLFLLVRKGARPFLSALKQRHVWAYWLSGSVALVVISKSLDGIGRKLAPYGVELSAEVDWWAGFVEEGFEWLFAMTLILAVRSWVLNRHTTSRPFS